MGRLIPLRWVFVASFGCVICSGAIAQAGPVNSVARYMGVGWSEGRHARNNCPHSLHPSKPWPFPITKLWNNQAAGPFTGNGDGHQVPESAIASPLLPQQAVPQHVAPQQRAPGPNVAPPRTRKPATPQREELRGGKHDDEERSPSDEFPKDWDGDPMNLPPPPPLDDEPVPVETRAPRSIMRNSRAGR